MHCYEAWRAKSLRWWSCRFLSIMDGYGAI
jgi:hypothetical protein